MSGAARFIVGGKVQGVFFRASTREQASALGLRGYAKNLPDGRVDILAVGDAEAIDQLADWLRRGPPQARVDELERVEVSEDEMRDGSLGERFTIL
ncbi:acylphosphatase [Lysobacter concretionis Ko07 = DSM 16239]|uniref:Acylphosphatase n=1 Tax=Lysobacter concretionis Ko07 = DSM 16239 TaxID=1122185 RepID=A0A0A0EKW5_9GAMM|nr:MULTISPECIES: acylphosphatase [Lysobacter]KGM50783.1 acylphosphatase [Lysobacter concretionis Ko07 = DSM 16239]QOD91570.1 acylphosphatase [Lysobacter sp. CW239]